MDAQRVTLALATIALSALSAAAAPGAAPVATKQRGVPSATTRGPGAAFIPSVSAAMPGGPSFSVPAVPIIAGAPGMGIVVPESLRVENPLPSRIEAAARFNPANGELGKGLSRIGDDVADANRSIADNDVSGALDSTQRKYDNSAKAGSSLSVADAQREFSARVAAFASSGKVAGYSGKDADLASDIGLLRRHIGRMDPSDPDYKAANALLRDLIGRRAASASGAK